MRCFDPIIVLITTPWCSKIVKYDHGAISPTKILQRFRFQYNLSCIQETWGCHCSFDFQSIN